MAFSLLFSASLPNTTSSLHRQPWSLSPVGLRRRVEATLSLFPFWNLGRVATWCFLSPTLPSCLLPTHRCLLLPKEPSRAAGTTPPPCPWGLLSGPPHRLLSTASLLARSWLQKRSLSKHCFFSSSTDFHFHFEEVILQLPLLVGEAICCWYQSPAHCFFFTPHPPPPPQKKIPC